MNNLNGIKFEIREKVKDSKMLHPKTAPTADRGPEVK